ncbi:MAG: mannosyltransferase family protein [Patescibacteria group bacterium]
MKQKRTAPIWLKVLIIFLAWKVLLLFAVIISVTEVLQIKNPEKQPKINAPIFIQAAVKWDAGYYLKIAEEGYGSELNSKPAFFPLFPLLLKTGTSLTGMQPATVGLIINTFAAYFACLFLYLLAIEYFSQDKESANRTLLLFLFFPMSFFLTALYTEALTCALTFGAFYYAKKQRWALANFLLLPLTALRLPGLIAAGAIFTEYLSSQHFSLKKIDRRIGWFILAPLGLIGYMTYLYFHFGDALAFLHAYNYEWEYYQRNFNILATVWRETAKIGSLLLAGPAGLNENLTNELIYFIPWVATFVLGIIGLKKMPASYSVLTFLTLFLVSSSSHFVAVGRYVLPLFPNYLILTDLLRFRSPALFGAILAASAILLGIFLLLFSNGYWVS